ncbi:MAG TPA: efflux RND transporter periplasmic adaptor subunit [candidate division Zixibacteria bacterium]|nr:efflux RND transporter periplasmic adaptor subunit [candidate division Zixibacteria bacterium]
MISEKPDLSSLRIERESNYRPPRKWWRWVLGLSIIPILVIVYLLIMRQVSPGLSVQVGTATLLSESQAQALLTASGYVVAQRQAAVSSKATGRLKYIGVVEGDKVKEGQIIARLENADIAAELERAKANLALAKAESTEAALFYQRQKKLYERTLISKLELEMAEARYQKTLASVEANRAGVKAAEVALENTLIRAPFDGTVLTKSAEVGEMVAPFAATASSRGAVVTIADMNSLEVEADVAEANIERVKAGQPCRITLDAYPSTSYSGKVSKIVPTADRTRATVLVKIAFNKLDQRVLPEMSAKISFLPETAKVNFGNQDVMVAVPNSAVTNRDGVKMVFLLEGNTAKSVPVGTGKVLGDWTEIKEGVKPGDKVILAPPGSLASGVKVKTSQ